MCHLQDNFFTHINMVGLYMLVFVQTSSVSARDVGCGCPEKRSKKKTEQRKLFVWVNPPHPFPLAIGRESSQWVGGEVDFLWTSDTGPTCKIFLTSPRVFILERKKGKRSPSLRKTVSLCVWYLDACLVLVLLHRHWWRGFRFFCKTGSSYVHMYETCIFERTVWMTADS